MWYSEQLSQLKTLLTAHEDWYLPLALHFAAFIQSRAVGSSLELGLAAALVSQQTAQGHICVSLHDYAGNPTSAAQENDNYYPTLDVWVDKLLASGVVGRPGDHRPLILDGKNRLYLHRFWGYEQVVIRYLSTQKWRSVDVFDRAAIRIGLQRYFGHQRPTEIDWQTVAGAAALWSSFCVITGGPGTGKTTTVAKILALLIDLSAKKNQRIHLAAPTGKAAARLQESMAHAKAMLELPPEINEKLPDNVLTIHRLLGGRPHSASFKHNQDRPLSADVVVVDEASMVDLPLLAKLLLAMPPACRLVLLGDPYQLASVEPGSVFADICTPVVQGVYSNDFVNFVEDVAGMKLPASAGGSDKLRDEIVMLKRSYRFGEKSGIARLGDAISKGCPKSAFDILLDPQCEDVSWKELPQPQALAAKIMVRFQDKKSGATAAYDPAVAFRDYEKFMVLCALRHGHYGVENMNRIVADALAGGQEVFTEVMFAGKPLMIRENDYQLRLFNGDIGIVLPDSKGGIAVYFRTGSKNFRALSPHRLPEHETAYAMTVHKSQGSEFDTVLVVLPDFASPVLTRELLYTAVTRARKKVEIWAQREILELAIDRKVKRDSGISDMVSSNTAPR